MTNIEKRLNDFIDLYKKRFVKEASLFDKHIRSLTNDWRDSGFVLDSLLTPGKLPIEFSYNFSQPVISYTIDPGLASYSVKKKWNIINSIVGTDLSEQYDILKPYMMSSSQRFGCWLSARHLNDQVGYKLYQEITNQDQLHARKEIIEHLPDLALLKFKSKLIGVNVNCNAPEYYLNFGIIDESTLFKIMKIAGVQRQCPSFLVQLAALKGANYQTVLNDTKVGASFKIGTNKEPSLTLFFHASELFSTNLKACSKISKLGMEIGNADLYKDLTESILRLNVDAPVHSILSFKFLKGDDFDFSIGISPF